MMKKRIILVVLLVFIGLIAGCSQAGSEYEGKWITSSKSILFGTQVVLKMEIKKNGENYIIDGSTEQYEDAGLTTGKMREKAVWAASGKSSLSATLKDGRLIVDPQNSFTFVKNDGTILGPNGTVFQKETPELLNKFKKQAAEVFKSKNPKMTIEE